MAKILINDGIHPSGEKLLREAGHTIQTEKIAQDELATKLQQFDAICVRSATTVRKDLIDCCPNLKVIGRGGVGLDNIDVDYARERGIQVVNTPAASSRSVAELAMGHLFVLARFLHHSNRSMPSTGQSNFKELKKTYSQGFELYGKTIAIIGFGKIGQETAQLAMSIGMNVLAVDPFVKEATLMVGGQQASCSFTLQTIPLDEAIMSSDVVSLHLPFLGSPVLSDKEFNSMKDGTILINASRGGTVDEDAMIRALDSGKLAAAGVDVFIGEPRPRHDVLTHPKVSLSPHTGASTREAQEKIGTELAQKLINILN